MLYPFWYVIVCSFSSLSHVQNTVFILWPDGLHLEAYQQVFRNELVPTAYANTLFVTLVGTAISMVQTILGAFGPFPKGFARTESADLLRGLYHAVQRRSVPLYLQVRQG